MNNTIAKNLRRLRLAKDVKQEDLARYIGCSSQAVSKWERGDGLPDIALLPQIAAYFKVTLDEIFGMDEIGKQQQIEEMRTQFTELAEKWRLRGGNDVPFDHEGLADLMRQIVRELPDAYELHLGCANHIANTARSGDKDAYIPVMIDIYERIIENCADRKVCDDARRQLCFLYAQRGDIDRANAVADEIGASTNASYDIWIKPNLNKGKKRMEMIQDVFIETLNVLWHAIFSQLISDDEINIKQAECVAAYLKWADMIEAAFGKTFYSQHKLLSNYMFALSSAVDGGETELALKVLERHAECAILIDTLPKTGEYGPLLPRGTFDFSDYTGAGNVDNVFYESAREWMLAYLALPDMRKLLEEQPRYKSAIDRLRASLVAV